MQEISSLQNLVDAIGVDKVNSFLMEHFMMITAKAKLFDKIELAVEDGCGIEDVIKIMSGGDFDDESLQYSDEVESDE